MTQILHGHDSYMCDRTICYLSYESGVSDIMLCFQYWCMNNGVVWKRNLDVKKQEQYVR